MSTIEKFVLGTHRLIENRPEPYGAFHLAFVGISLLLIALVCRRARNSSDRTFRRVMFSVGALLLASEGYKQLYYYYAVDGTGYDWEIFPFQLCSVPMYLSLVVGCMRKGRARDGLCEYLASVGFLGGIMAYVEPSGILNESWFTLIHSCLWHGLLIFLALYILSTGNACRSLRGYKSALVVLAGVVATATALNVAFRGKEGFNMCYISPYYNTPLAVFSSLDVLLQRGLGTLPGRVASAAIYVAALVLGGFLVYGACWYWTNKKNRRPAAAHAGR